MKRKIRKLFREHSPYLIVLTLIEIVFSICAILAFVYQDKLDFTAIGNVDLLIENLYSQTWWGLVLLVIALIGIFALTSIIYKKLDYLFISICCWCLLYILSININNSLKEILTVSLLFIPIIIINIIAYNTEKAKLNTKKVKKINS